MDVAHAVLHDTHHSLDVLVVTHGAHGVALHQDVAIGQEFESFQSLAVWSDQTLPSLDELFLVAYEATDFDDFCEHAIIFDDLDCLLKGHRPGKQFDQIACLNDLVRVPRVSCRSDDH